MQIFSVGQNIVLTSSFSDLMHVTVVNKIHNVNDLINVSSQTNLLGLDVYLTFFGQDKKIIFFYLSEASLLVK